MAHVCLAFTATLSATAIGLIGPVFSILAQHKPGASPSSSITSWLTGATPAPGPIDISQFYPEHVPLNPEQHSTFGEPVALSNLLMLIAIAYLIQPAGKSFKNCFVSFILSMSEVLSTAVTAVCNILRASVVLDHRLRVSDLFVLAEVVVIFLFINDPILHMPARRFAEGRSMDYLLYYSALPSWSSFLIKTAFTALIMALMGDFDNLRTHCRIFTHFLAAAVIVKVLGCMDWDRLFAATVEYFYGPPEVRWSHPRVPT